MNLEKITARLAAAYAWLDERTGVKAAVDAALYEPIRGGARWAYVFGSALLFLFAMMVVTGICMTLYYVPSADHAHTSVAYIQKVVPGGALIRGLHHYGASTMIIVAVLHLAQGFLFGAYKQRRELIWLTGAVMLLLLLLFSFTGYLLPWDQAAYFGTKVGASIAGEIPLIGPLQRRILLGGEDLSTLTLSRFFTVHVFLLPLGLAGLAGLHLLFFRRSGPAGPYHNRDDNRVERFYPGQVFKDSVAMLAVFLVLVYLAYSAPAELGPVADPTADYLARPPWFFMPLFQMLKYFEGQLSLIPIMGVPALLFGLLFLLPFFDRNPERHPLKRKLAVALLALFLIGPVALIALARYQDTHHPEFGPKLQKQEEEMRAFLKAPFEPQVVGGKSAVKAAAAPQAYLESCAACHGEQGEGAASFPKLIGVTAKPQRTKEDLLKILDDSEAYQLELPMPKSFPKLSAEQKKEIVEWLATLK
ncbi:MAG: cytochrome b N-terminal domain-containing protein [Acidobacteria bacterium]|nr:cytochrome b N-terminal domain-containing protein [Acidobacteriota bacterium]MBI3423634.1 cytochrome b N-terminal domain-containing protein [Acidobacteriota bacterium]